MMASREPTVRIIREEPVFYVIYRSYGWAHTNLTAALEEARELAAGHGSDIVPRIIPR